jgi:dolichol-phosphate mannosyltransferase
MPRTLIVMPTYDEALNIDEVLRRVRTAAPTVDVLVVDDNSPDGTAAVARRVADELGQIDVLVRERKDGLGNAYRHGFRVGFDRGYEVLMQMDADLSHDPEDVPRLLEQLDRGAELTIGSRYVPGGSVPHWAWHRRALSRYGNRYACVVLGMAIRDATAGFRAYHADTLKAIDVFSTRAKGYGFQVETAYRVSRLGCALEEVPVVFRDRVRGASKMSLSVMGEEMLLVTWWGIRDRLLPRLRRRTKRLAQ